jgi:hypothetical protein
MHSRVEPSDDIQTGNPLHKRSQIGYRLNLCLREETIELLGQQPWEYLLELDPWKLAGLVLIYQSRECREVNEGAGCEEEIGYVGLRCNVPIWFDHTDRTLRYELCKPCEKVLVFTYPASLDIGKRIGVVTELHCHGRGDRILHTGIRQASEFDNSSEVVLG